MASTPKIIGPDQVSRENFVFSTNLVSRFFEGTMDSDTVSMEVSIRGAPFTADPDLILFEGSSFTIPNSSVYPEGLDLAPGENVILVRSISFSGAVSSNASITVTLLQDSDIGLNRLPPSQFFIEQKLDAINLTIGGIERSSFQGINFYASRAQGGGALGYQKINLKLVTDFESEEVTEDLFNLEVDSSIALNPDGTVAADPLYLKIQETQVNNPDVIERLEDVILTPELAEGITEKEQQELLKTDFVKTYEVPELVRNIRTTYNVKSIVESRFYSFLHNRSFGPSNIPATIAIGEFASLPSSEPLYYIARAVYFDSNTNLEVESSNSIERVGKPTRIERNVGTPPQALTQANIQKNLIASLNRTEPELATVAGSVSRDVFVDPVSIPLTNLAFEADFNWRAQSFETLLPIDVDFSTGNTIPVSQSSYKQALRRVYDLRTDTATQTLLDSSFEQLAFRFGKTRLPGVRARGFVTFFTRNRPQSTIFIPLGTRVASGSIVFITTSDAIIDQGNLASFFNPTTGVYSIDVPVRAQEVGISANVSQGQIRTIVDNVPGISVTNQNRIFGGKGRETNLELAIRTTNTLSSVDTGTQQGINSIVAQQAGVLEATTVSSGDPLMQRDLLNDQHIGGKSDIWIRGESLGEVTDTFAFTFETAEDVVFVSVGNINNLIFRSLDVNLSTENPLFEMISNPLLGLGLRNATTGEFFDLTGYEILDYRTIRLSDSVVQPVFGLGNVILGDYRYATTTRFIFPRQPVREVTNLVGQISGTLESDTYQLIKPKDPALEGRSLEAEDYLNIFVEGGIPSGGFIEVTNEQKTFIGEFQEFLNNLGANPLTVRVYNLDKTIEYRGPSDSSGFADFSIIPGTQTSPLMIQRTDNSQIRSGESVLVDYSHVENFTVSYLVNQVVETTQEALDLQTHIASDNLIKEAIPAPLDITTTVTYERGLSRPQVNRNILTNLQAFINVQRQGARISPSQIITQIQNTTGVTSVTVPLTKLARSEGSQVVREGILNDSVFLQGTQFFPLSNDTVSVFLLTDEFEAVTSNGGGTAELFRGVYQDDQLLFLRTSDPFQIRNQAGGSYIIGQEGLAIPGYSDDTTILAQFPDLNQAQIDQKRAEITGNRVLLSLLVGDRPELHDYHVTYTVAFLISGSKLIQLSSLEYFTLDGEVILTLEEDN